MNLQPLYDVKERLEQAAIAGTGLLGEDFRLTRAAEALRPLAAASPVFGKIDAGLSELLSAPAEERPGLLLDSLALVDAVAYTQAKTGADGELAPLSSGCGQYQELSYSQLQPLLAALTTTGGGRMETIQSAWDNHPELFADFRVLPALVAGLGDSYGDIADLNGRILRRSGSAAIPLLKEGFDPAGKKEMARRVQDLEEIAGAAENPWYLEQLSRAKKPVRQALILALRHDPANAQALIGLCQTEKKECQEAARFALARMETGESRTYWETLAQKDMYGAVAAMRLSAARTATELTAGWFLRTMERVKKDPTMPLNDKMFGLLGRLRTAIECKTGPEVCEVFRTAAGLGAALDRDYAYEENGKTKTGPMRFYCRGATTDPDSQRYFSAAMPFTLMRSIQFTRDGGAEGKGTAAAQVQAVRQEGRGHQGHPPGCAVGAVLARRALCVHGLRQRPGQQRQGVLRPRGAPCPHPGAGSGVVRAAYGDRRTGRRADEPPAAHGSPGDGQGREIPLHSGHTRQKFRRLSPICPGAEPVRLEGLGRLLRQVCPGPGRGFILLHSDDAERAACLREGKGGPASGSRRPDQSQKAPGSAREMARRRDPGYHPQMGK